MSKQSIKFLDAPVEGGFRMDGYWVWCGSVVEQDGKYHMFASRWPKHLPMHPGWVVHSEIVRAISDKPEGPYQFEEVVLPARGAEYWDGRATHNPFIMKHKDTYILFYMGSTNPFPDIVEGDDITFKDPRTVVCMANKRIGIATSKSVYGPWERKDKPILDTKPSTYYDFLVSNPSAVIEEDGSTLLVFKGRKYEDNGMGKRQTLGVAKAPHYEGPYKVVVDEPIFDTNKYHLEDPFIWKSENGYEMIAKDMDGNACGEKHGGIHAYSVDGVKWKLKDNPLAYSRYIKWDDGKILNMGSFERPFLLFQDGFPTHIFAATADGPGCFTRASNTWNMVVPISLKEGMK